MILNTDGQIPLYIQIAIWLENEILNENFTSHDKVYSQYQLAEMFTINPATAAKGLNRLVDNEILYKKRGLGMFVTEDAKEIIVKKRRDESLQRLISELVLEASRLRVQDEELISMLQKALTKVSKGEKR